MRRPVFICTRAHATLLDTTPPQLARATFMLASRTDALHVLLSALWEVLPSPHPATRQALALLTSALVPRAPLHALLQHVLPAACSLSVSEGPPTSNLAVTCLGEALRFYP